MWRPRPVVKFASVGHTRLLSKASANGTVAAASRPAQRHSARTRGTLLTYIIECYFGARNAATRCRDRRRRRVACTAPVAERDDGVGDDDDDSVFLPSPPQPTPDGRTEPHTRPHPHAQTDRRRRRASGQGARATDRPTVSPARARTQNTE